jgi:hypothetical protein
MTQPDPLEGSKRKKVKVLLRKMIPAPLLSHISSDEDIEERFSTTPIAVTQENKNIQVILLFGWNIDSGRTMIR